MAPRNSAANNSKASSNSKLKQGSLFSFFGKKPVVPVDTNKPKSSVPETIVKPVKLQDTIDANVTSKVKNGNSETGESEIKVKEKVENGCRIEVYWPDDDEWYAALVSKQRGDQHYLEYDDGQCEWIDLSSERYRTERKTAKKNSPKRRRIQEEEDDDEEFTFDDDVSDDGSVYHDDGVAAEDDEDLVVTDDENDDASFSSKKTKNRKRKLEIKSKDTASNDVHESLSRFKANKVKVTQYNAPSQSNPSNECITPKQITPHLSNASSKKTQLPSSSPPMTKACANISSPLAATKSSTSPPMFNMNEVNQAGSHVHNHLNFLRNPKDSMGRSKDHPEYDCRTLKVNEQDWIRLTGKPMTDAVKQWWDLKSQYFDTVLLFKTGKFYEMFHMDADIGVQVCGFIYMKGHCAHSGFPEISYGLFADKLVRAGYKVARVEQTETPQQLHERKKLYKGKGAPKVVNREVCSILTMGTRTFCYLDQSEVKDKESIDVDRMSHPDDVGSLLAIKEIIFDVPTDVNKAECDEDEVQPVCEYGITVIDSVRGCITIGQFADDILRSRMLTLLTTFTPSEILIQGGAKGASETLHSLLRSLQTTSQVNFRIETIQENESYPKSTAIDSSVRKRLERGSGNHVHPWDVEETVEELHRRKYYRQASKRSNDNGTSRWPHVLQAVVDGKAELALGSFGAAMYYLQRNMIDHEILSMGIVKAYIPPESCAATDHSNVRDIMNLAQNKESQAFGSDTKESDDELGQSENFHNQAAQNASVNAENDVTYMSLDGTTLHNLEILTNAVDHKVAGSLWSKINFTKTPHGARLLRAWLLRPLFRKADIDRRLDAVAEMVSGGTAVALQEARTILSKCGDIERLLSRVHSMGSSAGISPDDDDISSVHPNERAVLYETATYTRRKVGDFSKVLNGLRHASQIPEIFDGINIQSGLLSKVVRLFGNGGCFPDMIQDLDWFFSNFDCDLAAKGLFEPSKGIDEIYDSAHEKIEGIKAELSEYKSDMCSNYLTPRALAKSSWNYINTKPDSKDKYTIELLASVGVPDDFILKGKRGSGAKQVNKYRTNFLDDLVQDLDAAYDILKERKSKGMQLIFAKFDSKRDQWAAAAQATALLDALGSLAHTASKAGYTRPIILDCPLDASPTIKITQGRHPCVENNMGSDFIPNDLYLGSGKEDAPCPRVLLLSGPNMGGKSTLLRQTCLISILSQIGCFVPAAECEITPIDRIFTRLGASDRILLGQSTFFVELAETASALRGATRRSLVIMDELGRGTSTFDGTAIASATVQHLVERSQCLSLFATHYHSLLDEWKNDKHVKLGHMECLVESGENSSRSENTDIDDTNITFLYTLGEGVCPKSFGINVARLAGLPTEVLVKSKRISSEFEKEICMLDCKRGAITCQTAQGSKENACEMIKEGNWESLCTLWQQLQE